MARIPYVQGGSRGGIFPGGGVQFATPRNPEGGGGGSALVTPYSATVSYNQYQLVVDTSDDNIYLSLVDDNLGNPLNNTNFWSPAGASGSLGGLSDVTIASVANGQGIEYNSSTSMWENKNLTVTPVNPNPRLGVAVSPSSIVDGAADTTVTVTLSILNPLTGETISDQSVTVTDPNGSSVAVTGSANTWTFTAAQATNVVGSYHVSAAATFTAGGESSNHQGSATVVVHSNWFTQLTATQPTDVTGMTSQGVWSSPQSTSFAVTGSNNIYIALPTRTGGYTFKDGFIDWGFTSRGVIPVNGDHTLYEGTDPSFKAGQTYNVTIAEA